MSCVELYRRLIPTRRPAHELEIAHNETTSVERQPDRLVVESPELQIPRGAFRKRWPWRVETDAWPEVTTVRARFATPTGFERVDLEGRRGHAAACAEAF